jgi:hypothetical protein
MHETGCKLSVNMFCLFYVQILWLVSWEFFLGPVVDHDGKGQDEKLIKDASALLGTPQTSILMLRN